jgi:pimeloyl-ACP methyl ester carboxylesterase
MAKLARTSLVLLVVLLVGASTAVASTTAAASTMAAASTTTAGGSSSATTIEGRFDVGGHSLYLRCDGTGSPTIVYLHGAIWNEGYEAHRNGLFTAERLADEYRVCVYDRRNVGRSDTVDAVQRPQDMVADLHDLLAAAAVEPPYVFLAASFGGVLGYLYLNSYPADVVGMVQLDSMFPDELFYEHLFPQPERYTAFSKDDACCTLERISHYRMLRTAFRYIGREPAVPMTYFSSLQDPREYGIPRYDRIIVDVIRRYVGRFSPGTFVPVDAPHFMEPAIPDEIADAVRDVIAHVRP